MKVLKKKYRKIIKIPKIKKPLPKIIIKPKLGCWCDYYEGRLPYPIECQTNKSSPKTYLFDAGKKTLLHNRTKCADCIRSVEFIPWKDGHWDKVKEAIINGEDLRDMPSPFSKE